MAKITKVTILDGTTYDLGTRIETIRGTQTAATGSWTGVSEDDALYEGKIISYYLPYAPSGNATLNLTLSNGSTTGAINCYYNGASRLTTHFGTYSTFCLIYHKNWNINGTNYTGWWVLDKGYDTNSTCNLSTYYTGIKTATLWGRCTLAILKNETTILPFNAVDNSTATNKTLTSDTFNVFEEVYYRNVNSSIAANTVVANNTMFSQIQGPIDLRLTFNTGTTLTANKAVYLVCTPQTNGFAKLASTPITQTLPTTEDGNYYKYLGQAYDTYRLVLSQNKPVYQFIGGKICLATGIETWVRNEIIGAIENSY